MTGAEFRRIRKKYDMDVVQFGRALGYEGAEMSVGMIVYRFEQGVRPIPFAIARLVKMFDKHGIPPEFKRKER